MQKLSDTCFSGYLPKLAAVAALIAPAATMLPAQETATPAENAASIAPVHPTLNLDLRAAMRAPVSVAELSAGSSSSSSEAAPDPAPAGNALAAAADGSLQPPPYRRRRYGSPSYSDKMHNADGSSKLAFVAGGGLNIPVGSASTDYLKLGWRFQGGVGYNLSRKLGVMAQFDWDNFGLPGVVLANQQALYSALDPTDAAAGAFQGIDGHSHIWSLTLNPTLNIYQTDTLGAYVVVGGGFYHKVTNFTLPSTGEYCDPYYGYCYQYQANQTFDSYTSNAPGVTGGLGVTYKFSRFANQKFFAEARYVHTFNQTRAGDPFATGASTGTRNNFYPPNSNETSYIPVTVGIRF